MRHAVGLLSPHGAQQVVCGQWIELAGIWGGPRSASLLGIFLTKAELTSGDCWGLPCWVSAMSAALHLAACLLFPAGLRWLFF